MKSILILDDGKNIVEKEVSAFNGYDGIMAFFERVKKNNQHRNINILTIIVKDIPGNVLGMCHKTQDAFYYCISA